MIKNKKIVYIIIAIYQLLGSILGIYALSLSIIHNELISILQNLIFISPIVVYSFLTSIAMILYINDSSKVLVFSYINQAIQIIQFKLAGYGVYIILGTSFQIGFVNNIFSEFFIDFELINANVNINLFSDLKGQMLLINLIPIIIILLLKYYDKKLSD